MKFNQTTWAVLGFVFAVHGAQAATNVITGEVQASCVNAVDCSISGVNLDSSVSVMIEGRASTVKLLGAGMRKKKIAIIPINVYVAELLATDASKYVRTSDGALGSLDAEQSVVMKLTFVRDVDAGQIQSAFQDAFAANNVDTSATQIATLLDAVSKGGVAKSGKAMVFVGEKLADGTEVLTYQSAEGDVTSVHGAKGFVSQVMSMWMGTPADRELGGLKNDLLTDRPLTAATAQ